LFGPGEVSDLQQAFRSEQADTQEIRMALQGIPVAGCLERADMQILTPPPSAGIYDG
jgi:hypothetical protein